MVHYSSMTHHWIDDIPRRVLGFLPTPLVPLDRFSEQLGGPRVWMKRDDCTGLATGGNKTRKLEYLLAAAQAGGADVVITYGAIQSNHARQTAAACAATGLECHLILVRKVPWQHPAYERSGNVQLDRMLGANVHLVEPSETSTFANELLAELKANDRTPYVIPVGGSNAIGALGYVRCAREIVAQSQVLDLKLTDIVHASSSAGTQSGLLAGLAEERSVTVHGINVSEPAPELLEQAVWKIACEVLSEHHPTSTLSRDRIRVDHRYIGTGYGLPTEATLDAIGQLGRSEGVLLDPVYSGKAMAGLIHCIREREFGDASDIVFIHTGGSASLPVYDNVV
ncbi:MAG: D-cysteine desulfhydrase family protein [Gammaproteobacteria bacterium]|nr:D-cysteine desulfhydrase family protein [Gammaproteobacteria bacterium]